jgi:hypothetical protein
MTTYLFPSKDNADHPFSLEAFIKALKLAHVEYEHYIRSIQERSQISQDKINNLVSYWFEKLPSLFLASLLEGRETVRIFPHLYPREHEYTDEFKIAAFKQALPHFQALLANLGVPIHFEGDCYSVSDMEAALIKVEDLKKLVG